MPGFYTAAGLRRGILAAVAAMAFTALSASPSRAAEPDVWSFSKSAQQSYAKWGRTDETSDFPAPQSCGTSPVVGRRSPQGLLATGLCKGLAQRDSSGAIAPAGAQQIADFLEAALDNHYSAQGIHAFDWAQIAQECNCVDAAAAAYGVAGRFGLALAQTSQGAYPGFDAIRENFGRALALEAQSAHPDRLPDWFFGLATLDRLSGDEAGYGQQVVRAFDALETVRPFLPLDHPEARRAAFERTIKPVFQARISLELDKPDPDAAETVKMYEAFRQAEMIALLDGDCLPTLPGEEARALRPGEIILYPIIAGDRVAHIIARAPDRERDSEGAVRANTIVYEILPPVQSPDAPVIREAAGRLIRALSEEPARRAEVSDVPWQQDAAVLYAQLIAPAEAELLRHPDHQLIIVPGSGLQNVPFAALTAADGRFLVERTRLSVAPTSDYVFKRQTLRTGRPNILAMRKRDDSSLRCSDIEILIAQGKVPEDRAQAIIDYVCGPCAHDATLRSIGMAEKGAICPDLTDGELRRYSPQTIAKQKAPLVLATLNGGLSQGNIDILHLSSHAHFQSAETGGIDSDIAEQLIKLPELRTSLTENLVRQGGLDLLVLSACATAQGDTQANLGLAGAAVQTGANSVLGSLWWVDGRATTSLMAGFYGNYLENGRIRTSKTSALQTAQLALLRSDEFRDPYYWAAFQLVGSDR